MRVHTRVERSKLLDLNKVYQRKPIIQFRLTGVRIAKLN